MQNTRILIAIALLLPICCGWQCAQNPKRPSRLSAQQLSLPQYDKFFNNIAGKEQINRIGDTVVRRSGAAILVRQTQAGIIFDGGKAAAGAYKIIDEQMVLGIYYDPNTRSDPPVMQLQVLARRDTPDGGVMGEYADPIILCDLSEAQADIILDQGIPQPLIDAMVKDAIAAGWMPNPPKFGQINLRTMKADPLLSPSN